MSCFFFMCFSSLPYLQSPNPQMWDSHFCVCSSAAQPEGHSMSVLFATLCPDLTSLISCLLYSIIAQPLTAYWNLAFGAQSSTASSLTVRFPNQLFFVFYFWRKWWTFLRWGSSWGLTCKCPRYWGCFRIFCFAWKIFHSFSSCGCYSFFHVPNR